MNSLSWLLAWAGWVALVAAAGFLIYALRRIRLAARLVREAQEERDRLAVERADLNRLLAMAAHELRNPLQTIIASVDLLALRVRSGSDMQVIDRLLIGAEQLEANMRDLTDFTYINSGRMVLSPQEFDPAADLALLVDSYRADAQRKGQDITLVAGDSGRTIYADVRRFRQIAGNLITNAIKYAEPGDIRVSVSFVARQGGGPENLVLSVEDDGPGIKPENIALMFEEFVQFNAKSGIGMGLAIVKKLVALLGGSVSVTSPPNRGARFEVRLPVVPRPVSGAA